MGGIEGGKEGQRGGQYVLRSGGWEGQRGGAHTICYSQ